MYSPLVIFSIIFLYGVSATVIGIDFGSSSYKIVLVRSRDFTLVLNEQSSRKTKNVVSIRDDTRHFGSQAENLARFAPLNSFNYLRDLLGKPSPDVDGVKEVAKYIFYANKFVQSVALHKNGTPTDYTYISIVNEDQSVLGVYELVAMILSQAHKMAEKAAEGPVVDCVITVPAYFTQRERQALIDAASLGGLKVLSLINEGTAYGLKYAIDRTFVDEIEEENVLFYDHGESSLQLTLINFSKTKNKKNVTVPQARVVATSWDIALGTREFDRRLAEHFVEDIKKKHNFDIKQNLRAYSKLISELKKCREVLSANKEASFMVEGVTNDLDYGGKMTREAFETMNADLFSHIVPKIENLLQIADIPKEKINGIEMVGGAIRIPKIQKLVKEYFGRDTLDFHINADEGAVFGAAFFAAGLSVQHRVKDLKLKDITPWKVSVNVSDVHNEGAEDTPLEIEETEESSTGASSAVNTDVDVSGAVEPEPLDKFAPLFRRGNRYGSRKTLSFHTSRPFQLQLRYDEDEENSTLPKGTDPLIETYVFDGLPSQEKYNYTGTPKVHVQFVLSSSGIIELVKAEAEITVVEYVKKTKSNLKQKEEADNTGSTINSEEEMEENAEFESEYRTESPDENSAESEVEQKEQSTEPETETKIEENKIEKSDEENSGEKLQEQPSESLSEQEEVIEFEEVRKTQLIPLIVTSSQRGQLPPDAFKKSAKLLQQFDDHDRICIDTENAKNDLESYIYYTQDKLLDELIISMSTEEERQKLSDALSAASIWLEDEGENAKLSDFVSKKSDLVSVGEAIFFRVRESTARMDALYICVQTVNMTRLSLENITERVEVTQEEVQELLGLCDLTEKWMVEKYKEQEELELWKDPILTSEEINTKCKEVTKLATRLLRRPKKKVKKVEQTKIEDENETQDENEPSTKEEKEKQTADQPPEPVDPKKEL